MLIASADALGLLPDAPAWLRPEYGSEPMQHWPQNLRNGMHGLVVISVGTCKVGER